MKWILKKWIEFKDKCNYWYMKNKDNLLTCTVILVLLPIIIPILILYLVVYEPLVNGFLMLRDANELGLKVSYRKHFKSEEYKKEEFNKVEAKKEEFKKRIPGGRSKSFDDLENWPDAYVVDGVAVYGAGGRILLYVDESVEEFDVPDGVVNIYHRCFACCHKLKRVSIPNTISRIGKRAFFECVTLKNVAMPDSVYIVGDGVFESCNSLESVILSSKMSEIPYRMFYKCGSLKKISLPENTKIIYKEAFKRCYSLEHIDINNRLEIIWDRAFEDCRSLKEFIMPESVLSCSVGMFSGCHSLQHIHFSSEIKDFGGSCCRDCWNINQISMPVDDNLKSFAKEKWESFAKFTDISKSENPIPESRFWTMGDALYFGIPRLTHVCLVFCFSKAVEFTVPRFVTHVKRDAFTSCRGLRTLCLSPFVKMSSDPLEQSCISYDFVYEYWPQVENVIFDETLKDSGYMFSLFK